MKPLLLALLLVTLSLAQSYDNALILTQSCAPPNDIVPSSIIAWVSSPGSPDCIAYCNQVGNVWYRVACGEVVKPDAPVIPGGSTTTSFVIYETRWSDDFCGAAGGSISAWTASISNTCIDFLTVAGISSYTVTCTQFTTWDAPGCASGNGTLNVEADPSMGCYVEPVEIGGSAISSCSQNSCFHEQTEITYGKQTLTKKSLEQHEDCAIPHEILTDGVKIQTTCDQALRLTNDHLVYTQSGLRTAGSVKVGDFLYNDMTEKGVCEVTSVEVDRAQSYFGLNCEESIVLANGYKTSTFGVTHDLPAIWMKYASKIFGVDAASSFGDMVANFLFNWKLI